MALEKDTKQSLRLALIASEHTVSEYSIFLEHLLVGLADESIPVALVCPPGYDADSLFTGAAEVISHPVFELPLTGHLNRRLLVEQLAKFKPTVFFGYGSRFYDTGLYTAVRVKYSRKAAGD